jgi:hypothetical protein
MQAFKIFHETTAESSDLYNCKQKDRDPLRNFVRRFMQLRSQVPEADDKTTIQALIMGLTPGPTASHLTRKPKQLMNFFMNLKSTSCPMTITAEESLNEMKQDKATEK